MTSVEWLFFSNENFSFGLLSKVWLWSYTEPNIPDYTHTLLGTPPDFHTFLQPEVDLAKKLTGAATAASQLLVCKHHWQLYGAGKSLLQSSKFWAKKTLIHWHPSFSFDFAMAGWLYFLVSIANFLASTILYVKREKIIGNKLQFCPRLYQNFSNYVLVVNRKKLFCCLFSFFTFEIIDVRHWACR